MFCDSATRGYFLQSCVFLCPQDFLIMFLHHVATISLITFSYVNNMARVGTLVMCLHDAADVLIEVRVCEGIKCCGWRDVWVEGLGLESSAVHLCISNTFWTLHNDVIQLQWVLIMPVFNDQCTLFSQQGCQDGQLRQMSDTVQPPVCDVWNSLHKFQAGSLSRVVRANAVLFPSSRN